MFAYARIIWCLERICTVLYLLMVGLLFTQVMLRYVFSTSLFWAEEAARYAMIWIVFLGSVMAACQGAHTRIGFFVDQLPKAIRRYVEAAVVVLCALVCLIIAWHGIPVFRVAMEAASPAMKIPLGVVFVAVPLCCGAMGVIMLIRGVLQFMGKPLPEDMPVGEVEA